MKLLAKALGFVLAIALFIVTVSCTVDLLSQILPAKYWYLPALGTAAFDVGFVAWLLTLLHDVENSEQRTVAWTMLVADFLGVAVTSVCDVFFYDATKGLVAAFPGDWVRWVVVAIMLIIIINVAAWAMMHLTSPKHIQGAFGQPRRPAAVAQPRARVVQAKPVQKRIAAPAPRRAIPAPKTAPAVLAQKAAQTVTVEEEDQADSDEIGSLVNEEEAEDQADSEEISDAEAEHFDELAQGNEAEEEDHEEFEPQDTEEIEVFTDQTEEAESGHIPLGQRLANAVEALTTPNVSGPTKLKRRQAK